MARDWRKPLEHIFYSEEWKELRKTKLVTPESYAPASTLVNNEEMPEAVIDPVINDVNDERKRYARFGSALEEKLANMIVRLEGGYIEGHESALGALFFPSGMAAISNCINYFSLMIPQRGREKLHFVAHETLYPETKYFFTEIIEHMGFGKTFFTDMRDETALARTLAVNQDQIVAVFYEPISNPALEYVDTRKVREVADWYDIPIIVDNTLLTPDLQQQLRLGADIVIHSLTKYGSGKSDLTAGVMTSHKKFIDCCRHIQGTTGNILDLASMDKLCERLPSLPERVRQHAANAAKIAGYMRGCGYIKEVCYPYVNSARYNSPGGMVSFIIDGERERKLLEACVAQRHNPLAVQVGFGSENYRVIPGSYLSEDIPKGFMRLSTGVTQADDVIDFLRTQLK